MKISMYRQPREAAIIYASTPEELHTAMQQRRRKRLHTILTLVLAVVSVIVTVALVIMMKNDWEEQRKPQNAATGVHDPLRPDAVEMTEELSEKVLRLHILANSDGTDDQEVKLMVRDAVLAYLTEHISQCETKEEVKQVIAANLSRIIRVANEALIDAGFSYTADARLTTADFPLKVYGDIFLPAGTYETLQITLGQADGRNWWCLIFPSLCLADTLVVMEPSTEHGPNTTTSQGQEKAETNATEDSHVTSQLTHPALGNMTPSRAFSLPPISEAKPLVSLGSTIVDPQQEKPSEAPLTPITTPSATPTPAAQTTKTRKALRDALEQREYEAIQVEHEEITFEISILNLLRFLRD